MPRIPAPVKSYGRAFAVVVLGLFLADGADVFAVDVTDLRTWLAAGLASVIGVALEGLDTTTPAFGRQPAETPADPEEGLADDA